MVAEINDNNAALFCLCYEVHPLITATGLSLMAFLLIPASWPGKTVMSASLKTAKTKNVHVSTTSVTFLYDSGA